ncbi:GNAT family N-acetyltransferase [Bacillus sp. AK128]
MEEIKFVRGFSNNRELRDSFNQLADSVFGIHFENWYKSGFWTSKYDPFSYMVGNKMVANVSVNHIELVINGSCYQGLQLGTVMTDAEYRNKGLSKLLMTKVLDEYEGLYDIMYLFANHSVLDFYPKFGFHPVDEFLYSMKFKERKNKHDRVRPLDVTNKKELNFIYQFVKERIPVTKIFSTKGTAELFMFYCLYVFPNHVYYLPKEDVVMIYKEEGSQLHLFDLVSNKEVDLLSVINEIASSETEKVIFHYMPDIQGVDLESEPYQGEQLFIKMKSDLRFPEGIKHPITSQA